MTGQEIYEAGTGSGNPKDTSAALTKMGIPGIKYLDQGSREVGEGTHNFVLFVDKLAKITATRTTKPSRRGPPIHCSRSDVCEAAEDAFGRQLTASERLRGNYRLRRWNSGPG